MPYTYVEAINRFSPTAGTTQFDFTFGVRTESEAKIKIIRDDAVLTGAPLAYGTDYTVAKKGNTLEEGGTITLAGTYVAGTETGDRVVVYADMDLDQETDLKSGDGAPSEQIEDIGNKLHIILGQIVRDINRAWKFPITDPAGVSAEMPLYETRDSGYVYYTHGGGITIANQVDLSAVTVTAFAESLLDDTNAAGALTTLGMSAFVQTLLSASTAGAFRQAIGVRRGYDLVLASSDSSAADQAEADETISTATDAAAAIETHISTYSATRVLLLAGTYNLSTQLDITIVADKTIKFHGVGWETVVKRNANLSGLDLINAEDAVAGEIEFAHFMIDGNQTAGAYGAATDGLRTGTTHTGKVSVHHIGVKDFRGYPFSYCSNVSDCVVMGPYSSTAAFYYCEDVVNCQHYAPGSGFYGCERMTNCITKPGSPAGNGYFYCNHVTNCVADGCQQGFAQCNQINNCKALNCTIYGFISCNNLATCWEEGGTLTYSFQLCYYMTACHAAPTSCTYCFQGCRWMTNCYGLITGGTCYAGCAHMQQNYADPACTTGYSVCYADLNVNAAANTAAGGYNQ